MTKTNLTRASRELFRREPDETFATLSELSAHCRAQKECSVERWVPPRGLVAVPRSGEVVLACDGAEGLRMSDWGFTQLCGLARAHKETVNRLSADTAALVINECLPQSNKPVQVLAEGERLRSVHGGSYSRLYNAEVLSVLSEFAVDFLPPPPGVDGKTGLYAGEQDLFCFLIDPAGWAEVDGEAFAPGFFVWNSEVGKRSVGVQTFWFQAVCRNHIVWDAVDVTEVTRKHTGDVHEALSEIRQAVASLVKKRDARRDGFVAAIRRAMGASLGDGEKEALEALTKRGFTKALGARALELARKDGRFTVFSVIDALTRLAGEMRNAGDRLQADQKAAGLLQLVAA